MKAKAEATIEDLYHIEGQAELVNGKIAQMTDMRDIWAQKLDRYHELLENLPQ